MACTRSTRSWPNGSPSSLIGSLIKSVQDMDWAEAERLITQFTRVAQPMAIDPRWNRLWAIIWDGPHADLEGAIQHWAEYIQDLETLASLTPSERALAQAIVWDHVARLHGEDVDYLLEELDEPPFSRSSLDRPGAGKKRGTIRRSSPPRRQVVDCLERSLRLAPTYLPTYRLLVEFHQDWEDVQGLEAAAQTAPGGLPRRHRDPRTPGPASLPEGRPGRRTAVYPAGARGSSRWTTSCAELEWMIRVGLARGFALSERWDEGRAEFAAADEFLPESAAGCTATWPARRSSSTRPARRSGAINT